MGVSFSQKILFVCDSRPENLQCRKASILELIVEHHIRYFESHVQLERAAELGDEAHAFVLVGNEELAVPCPGKNKFSAEPILNWSHVANQKETLAVLAFEVGGVLQRPSVGAINSLHDGTGKSLVAGLDADSDHDIGTEVTLNERLQTRDELIVGLALRRQDHPGKGFANWFGREKTDSIL